MKRPCHLTLSLAVATALSTVPPSFVGAEDIDLFVGNGPVAQTPNVLIILDNSANWSAANQAWPGGLKQGQSEINALRKVISQLKVNPTTGEATINVGLMMFTEGLGAGKDGGYIRFAIRPMTNGTFEKPNNILAFQQLLGDKDCTYSPTNLNSVNKTPNCIYGNYNKTEDQVGSGKADYQAAMFEAFKYYGGWTYPDDANAKPQVAADPGNPQSASEFGPFRYAGNLSRSDFVDRLDAEAFFNPLTTTPQYSTYDPPINDKNNCANNYIIFVGNGYVTDSEAKVKSDKDLMAGVKGVTTHIPMSEFTKSTDKTPSNIGFWCGTGGNDNTRRSACTADFLSNPAAATLQDSNPADSYACVGSAISDADFCSAPLPSGGNARKFAVATTAVTTSKLRVPPVFFLKPTNPDYQEKLADEWAQYLFTTDVNKVAGVQNVKTYTVDVFNADPSVAQNSLLYNMAIKGGEPAGTTYFQAKSESAIVDALSRIFTEIQSVNSVFAAASLPVSATNRAQNENQVFFGLFRPEEKALPRWYGNLKRYKIATDTSGLILAGEDGKNALSGGFFFDCAKSFWTTDSGSYWSFSGAGSKCPLSDSGATSVFSDKPDGPQVEKGAAAEVLRRGNTGDPLATTPFTVNRNMLSCANDGATINCSSLVAFDNTNVTQSALGAADTTERDNIINYTRGQNVKNEMGDGDLTQPRPSIHGDVVHSRPLPINYASETDKSGDKVVVFYGANDGTLRAVSTKDGTELWSFIAPEHHARLKRLYVNDQKVAFPNILAEYAKDPWTPAPAPKDYFFDGTIGALQSIDNSKIWIFPTMRRGGRMIYAFDVSPTDPSKPTIQTTPKLLWRKGCTNPDLTDTASCDLGFEDMGETWSTPNVAFIKNYNKGGDPVIVMGGGYDSGTEGARCEDTDVTIITNECDKTQKGRKVYVLDANSGKIIRSFDTDRSVPADVTLIDTDNDGFVDYAYAADTGGNVYRIDFTGANENTWSKTKVAHTASDSGRKFLFPPAALVAKTADGKTVVYLGLGSGDRERPLLTNYPVTSSPQLKNYFYVFVDEFTGDVDLQTLPDNDPAAEKPTVCKGWKMELVGDPKDPAKQVGEQTVTGALIAQGRVFWNTSRATKAAEGTCDSDLGQARGYNASLFSCGDVISTTYQGGGLPISPVLGTVTLADGSVVTICIGCAMKEGQTSQFTPGQVNPVPAPTRKKRFWKRDGDR